MSRQTIYRGKEELGHIDAPERVRRPGGGRKKLAEKMPDVLEALEDLVDPTSRGDPESPLRWTCKSVRKIADSLTDQGFAIGRQSVANLLHELDYSLQANRKTSEGKKDHLDRDKQFKYINRRAAKFLRTSLPVISVDTKKKELIGKYKNDGHEWEHKGRPVEVLSHDFPDPHVPKAVPYGVYDIGANVGWVNIGVAADTAEFAVASIGQWWTRMGRKRYPNATQLFVCADGGGSNGYRVHLWKHELQKFCNRQKWLRWFEQLSPIYKWTPGGLRKVPSGPRRRSAHATTRPTPWTTRGAPGRTSYAASFMGGSASRYFSVGVRRSRRL